jgi:hypothetical protein
MLSMLRTLGFVSRKASRKPSAIKPNLLSLESRVTPAVTALYNSTDDLLTVNLQNANETATITFDSTNGYVILSGSSPITILGGYDSSTDSVKRLIIRDSGGSASGQKVTLGSSATNDFTLDDGISISGIETVISTKAITVSSNNGVSITGASTSIQLDANITTDDQPVILDGPVVLSEDVTIDTDDGTGANVSFSSTINSITATTQVPYDIIITAGTTGTVSFAGNIGSTKNLDAINITGGAISLSGNVTSSGNISFTGDLTLNRNVTISSSSGDITFIDAIDSGTSSTPRTLTVGTPSQTGATTFRGALGGTNRLGAVTVHRTGTISIADDISTANAAVSFKGAVVLTGDSSISTKTGSNVGGNVSFQSTVNGTSAGDEDLTIDAGSNGTVSFVSTVGNSIKLGEIAISGKTIALGGNVTTGSKDIALTGAVILNSSPVISSHDGDITLNGSVNGSAINTRSIDLKSNEGNTIVNAVVGNLRKLAGFTVSDADSVTINNSITATTINITGHGGADDETNISVSGIATLSGSTTITSTATTETEIDVSGKFLGSVSIIGSGTTSKLTATSNSNFTVTGTDVTDRTKGTLTKTQPGRPAVITFQDINDLNFTGGASGNAFTLNEWFFHAEINGAGGTDILTVNRAQDATTGLEFTLDDLNLDIEAPFGSFSSGTASPINIDYALTSIESANISAGAGDDSFDISGWTGRANLAGGIGADQLIWSGSANSTLTSTSFVAGTLNASLSSIESADLENTTASKTFSISGFVGSVSITGVSTSKVTATYNANFSLTGTSDTVGTITTGGTTIDFTAGTVVLNGGNRDNTFNLNGTYLGAVTLDGGAGNDIYNITLPGSADTTNIVTVNDTGKTSRDTINATGTGGTLTRTLRTLPLLNLIRYGAEGASDRPGIDYTGVEIVNLL